MKREQLNNIKMTSVKAENVKSMKLLKEKIKVTIHSRWNELKKKKVSNSNLIWTLFIYW